MMKVNFVVFSCLLHVSSSLKSAVVIGSGPVGLASALVLAKRHGYEVTVLEAAERIDVYDPSKGYPFLIKPRGQKVTSMFPSLQNALEKNGVASEGAQKIVAVPADPSEILDTKPKVIKLFETAGRNFWIRRHEFNRILLDECAKEKEIEIVNGIVCKSLGPASDGLEEITVCADQSGNNKEFKASLVIASDGMNSVVRNCLNQSPSPFPGWENNEPSGFKPRRWFSPSSGLRFKTLNTKGDAEIPVGDGTRFKLPFDTSTLFAIRSVNKKATTAISLGILPSRKTPSRVYNVIRDPKHEIWKINDGNVLREWFSKSFPRLDFTSKSSIIDQSEFDRFVSVESLSLPPCQYSPGLFVSSPNKKSAVIIMGDAAHTFPPDIGEGVNSGLDDVFALDEALGSNENIGAVAASYATRQGPENKALIKLVRCGSPFQYGQFGGMMTFKKMFWSFNFFGRVLLNKLTFGLTPKPIALTVSEDIKYSITLRKSNMLTTSLWVVTFTFLFRVTGLMAKLSP